MEEKDIVRIVLVVLLLGFSLPQILRLIAPGAVKNTTRSKKRVTAHSDPPTMLKEEPLISIIHS